MLRGTLLRIRRFWGKLTLRRLERPLVVLIAGISLAVILMNFEFNLLEANLYDLRMSRSATSSLTRLAETEKPGIVLVTIDESTLKDLGDVTPLSMEHHARFIQELSLLEPKAVGYLVDLNRVNELSGNENWNQWAPVFEQATQALRQSGKAFILGTPFDVTGEILPPAPLAQLPHAVAVVHKDGNVFAEDRVTRRALLSLYGKPVFHTELAEQVDAIPAGRLPRGSFYIPEVDAQYFYFRYHGPTTLNPAMAAFASSETDLHYPRYSFVDVIRGHIPSDALKGKIVLVSTMTREDAGDYAYTPFSKVPFTNPKIAIHANILDSVMKDDGIVRAPSMLNTIITFSVVAFVLWWVLSSTPLYGVFATIGLAVFFVVFAHIAFQVKGVWIKASQPLVGIFLGYYLAVPYRLIREYKKRWDYQQKNEILIQVEEMKTNFLSLVTHDLKTPVARIQGLAETLKRKIGSLIPKEEYKNLDHIVASTDELNRFVSSILELTKVESNRLQINFESKDVNQLVEKAIEGFQTQSRVSEVKIVANLEPLFPIHLDPSLISKVLNNLIDNALKYSPAGSTVTVQTLEKDDFVEIRVHDQGIGLSEEDQDNLFTRFYRAKNDTTTRVTGTGLGLYLTKYFVEAHYGDVEVESELGVGSTFIIRLPLEFPAQPAKGLKFGTQTGDKKYVSSSSR
ncbi:MAG: CHASE2 domain-containing protein [Bdellovibrionales bacterium]|nr:CHASE2 domain-containing protein [Bdellovibrionales bacterium]